MFLEYGDIVFVVFFFFKQKTAYEMRISDWSSDVCSSDLSRRRALRDRGHERSSPDGDARTVVRARRHALPARSSPLRCTRGSARCRRIRAGPGRPWRSCTTVGLTYRHYRSEEHTSELQSLMRISYAVFCLKKKNIS